MNKINISITDEQLQQLKTLRQNKNMSYSNSIREALDMWLKRKVCDIDIKQQKITEGIWNGTNNS